MPLKRKPDETRRAGQHAMELARRDKARLEPRLSAGVIDGLAEDLELLDALIDDQKTAQAVRRGATRNQENAAERLAARIRTIRETARFAKLGKEVQAALGVGKSMQIAVVRTVTSAAEMVLSAYRLHTDALREAGVLPADIEEIRKLRDSLVQADEVQERQKITAREKTILRNQLLERVETALGRLAAAAALAFPDDPARVQAYRELTRGTRHAPPAPAAGN